MKTAKAVLQAAHDLIEDEQRWVNDHTAKGFNPTCTRNKAVVPMACLATADRAQRWNAAGAIWRQLRDAPEAVVKDAYARFVGVIAADTSVYRWCCTHSHAEHLAALKAATP